MSIWFSVDAGKTSETGRGFAYQSAVPLEEFVNMAQAVPIY
ncbi:hypothetical protein [Rossellomorea marisflavi]|nr:hypothetical protein [Rossellomorea marisflavi]